MNRRFRKGSARRRAGYAVCASALMMAGGQLAWPAPTSAAAVSCSLSGTASFSSVSGSGGISGSTDSVRETISGRLTNCSGGTVASGTFTLSRVASESCSDPSDEATATITVTWNTGKQSRASVSAERVSAGSGTVAGTVSSGVFAGDSFAGSLDYEATKGSCQPGSSITAASIAGTGTITS